MLRLLLLRHAKSLQDEALKDRDRPLNERGRGDAPRMGSYMHHHRYKPDVVLCSPSARTRETWTLLAPELGGKPSVRFTETLYLASERTIHKLIAAEPDSVSVLLVIGHNPGLEQCANILAREAQGARERANALAMRDKFPTCGLAILDFDVESWKDALAGRGALSDFAKPKGLQDK